MIKKLFDQVDTRYNWHKKFLLFRVIFANGAHYLVVCDYVWRRLVDVDNGMDLGTSFEWEYSLTEAMCEELK